MIKRFVISAVTAILFTTISQLTAVQLIAQEIKPPPTPRDNDQATQAKDQESIGDIIVTARKVSERVQDVPVAISAFSALQLQQRGIDDLEGIGSITPGLTLSQGTGASTQANVSIRGFSETDTQLPIDPAVGVYVDDVYHARSLNLSVGLFDLARVEVLKGPQGTLFGRNTTGGALNITTADPEKEFSGYLNGTYGNYDNKRLETAVSVPLSNNFSVRFATALSKRDGYARNVTLNRDIDDEDRQAYRGKLVWKPENWDIRLNADYIKVDESPVPAKATLIGACDPFAGFGIQAVFNPNCGTPANVALITGLYGPGGLIATAAGAPGGLLVNGALPPSLTNIPGAIDRVVPGTIARVLAENALAQSDPRRLYLDTQGYTRHEEYGGSFSVSHDFGTFAVKSITSYRKLTGDDLFDSDGTSLQLLNVAKPFNQEQVSQELQITGKALDNALTYAAGYFFFDETGTDVVDQQVGGVRGVTTLITDAENRSNALYAQGSYAVPFFEGLKFTLGYRQSWDDREVTVRHQSLGGSGGGVPNCGLETALIAAFGTPGVCAATLKKNFPGHSLLAGLDYRVASRVLVYGSYKEGFRSGGFSGRAGSLAQLQPVPPEEAYDFELGIKSDWNLGAVAGRLNVAAFHTKIDNRQREFTRLTPSGGLTTIIESAEKSSVQGFEVEGAIIPVRDLTLNFSASYTDASYDIFVDSLGVDRSNDTVPSTPKWHYTIGFVYSKTIDAGGTVNLSTDYSYLSSQVFGFNADPTVQSEAYSLINMRAGWDNILDKGFNIHGFVKNLTDKNYVNGGVFLKDNFGFSVNYIGPPRTYGVEVGFKF